MRLGVHVQAAVACGITSKGSWRSAKTPGINQALSNAYLKISGTLCATRWLDQASPFSVKRPVRTRMQGVVGRAG
jgi:hypothetical protein